jgi:hypothetical protein
VLYAKSGGEAARHCADLHVTKLFNWFPARREALRLNSRVNLKARTIGTSEDVP